MNEVVVGLSIKVRGGVKLSGITSSY